MTSTTGPDGTLYSPVIDISEHQGAVDFTTMRRMGVDFLILRTNHGLTVDARCRTYYRDAITAGFKPHNVGFYTFVNPKRGSALACAKAFVDTVESITGRDDNLLMLDVESYKEESPNKGVIWPSSQYAPWLNEHYDHIRQLAPEATVIAYSNASFWNVWVADRVLAAKLDWIVPRYPIYSAGGYALHPVPTPAGWAGWAFARAPIGPFPPAGAKWLGWQFSAGYNRQGPVYGCASSDLDLNFVTVEAWLRWTGTEQPDPTPPPVPPPSGEPIMPYLFKLPDGNVGLRDVTGSRPVSHGELLGPFVDEDEWPRWVITEADTSWKLLCEQELARYYRDLEPSSVGGDQTVHVKVDVSGP